MLHADSDHASASLEQTPPDESRLHWDRGALLGLFSSLFLHLLILVVLGLIVIRFPGNPEVLRLIVESPVNSQPTEELTEISVPNPELDSTLGMQDPSSLMTPQPETALSDFKPRLFAEGDVSAAQLASVRKIDVSSQRKKKMVSNH